MKRSPLNKELIEERLNFVEESYQSLERFRSQSLNEFESNPDNFRIAYYDLHIALEAILDIGAHILSRIPGARPSSYKDIPNLLGKYKILPDKFVKEKLVKMAGYRNRMVHFYYKLGREEIYEIIQNQINDFLEFNRYIKEILKYPQKYDF